MSPCLLNLTSLAKRLKEDADRCLVEMESNPIHYGAYTRIQGHLQAAKGRGAE